MGMVRLSFLTKRGPFHYDPTHEDPLTQVTMPRGREPL